MGRLLLDVVDGKGAAVLATLPLAALPLWKEANSGSNKCQTIILVPALNVLSTSLPILSAAIGIFWLLA
jgi:hypothetical protein